MALWSTSKMSSRTISTPFSSSPCTAAFTSSTGPGPLPFTTMMGMRIPVVSAYSDTLRAKVRVSPGLVSTPPMTIGLFTHSRFSPSPLSSFLSDRSSLRSAFSDLSAFSAFSARSGFSGFSGFSPFSPFSSFRSLPASPFLGTALSPLLVALGFLGDELHHGAGNVLVRGALEPLEAGRRIRLDDHRPALRLQDVDPRDLEPQDLRALQRQLLLGAVELDGDSLAALVDVRLEGGAGRHPAHRREHLVADDEGAQVTPARLGDEFLNLDVRAEFPQRLQHALHRLQGIGKHHACALGALVHLQDHGRAAHQSYRLEHRVGRAREHRLGRRHACRLQDLERPELVARV